MNVNLQQEKQIILDALDRTRSGCWGTAPEISRISGVNLEHVLTIVYNSGDFLHCAKGGKDGLPLFASRRLYKVRASFWNKLLDFLRGDYV